MEGFCLVEKLTARKDGCLEGDRGRCAGWKEGSANEHAGEKATEKKRTKKNQKKKKKTR